MKTITIVALTLLATCFSIQSDTKDLVGSWECYHKELEDGITTSIDVFTGEEFQYTCDGLVLEFHADFTGNESIGGLHFTYQRKDTILSLGNQQYIIEKLTKTELVIRNLEPEGIDISSYRQKFRKRS